MKLLPVPKQGHKFENRMSVPTECPWCGKEIRIVVRFGVINKRSGMGCRETFAGSYAHPSGSHPCVDPTITRK